MAKYSSVFPTDLDNDQAWLLQAPKRAPWGLNQPRNAELVRHRVDDPIGYCVITVAVALLA